MNECKISGKKLMSLMLVLIMLSGMTTMVMSTDRIVKGDAKNKAIVENKRNIAEHVKALGHEIENDLPKLDETNEQSQSKIKLLYSQFRRIHNKICKTNLSGESLSSLRQLFEMIRKF